LVEARPTLQPTTNNANFWKPAPKSIRDILKLPKGLVHQEWLKSVKKELKILI
jgi:hypothetical protein